MASQKVFLIATSAGLFLFFVFFSYLVHRNIFTAMDFNATVRLQDHVPRRLDQPFSMLSVLGSFEPMIILLIVILLLRRKLWGGIMAVFSFGILHLFEIYGKTFVNHHPPPEFMLRTQRLIQFPQFHVSEAYSYPSGHAGRALFITVLLAGMIWFSKKLSYMQKVIFVSFLVGYDVIMLLSRVYLGEHWTTDIIGGTILGASLGLFGLIFFSGTSARLKEGV